MAEYNFTFDWNRITTIGKVQMIGVPIIGAPSQESINAAVADYIDSHPGALSPLSAATKSALLQIAQKVAYIDENGQDYYDALDAALNAKALLSITAVYTQSMTVIASDSLDILKDDLVVTGYYDDGTSAPIDNYTLSGTLTAGTSTITVTSGNATTAFDVTVSSALYKLPVVPETTVNNNTISISKDGLITVSGTRDTVTYIKPDGTVTVTAPQGSSNVWFTVPQGANVVFRVYDITWENNVSGTTVSLDNKWCRSDATSNVMTASFSMTAGGSGTNGEASFTSASYSTQRTISAFATQMTYNNSPGCTVSLRIELTIDGVKYF